MDGARRLGRLARLLSIVFIVMGIIIIIVATTVNFAGEAQPYASLLGAWEAKGVAWPPGTGQWGGEKVRARGATTHPLTPEKQPNSQLNGTGFLNCLMPQWTKRKVGKSVGLGVRGSNGPGSWAGVWLSLTGFMSEVLGRSF